MPPDFRDTRQPEPAPQPLPAGPLIAVAVQSREPSFYDKEQLKFQVRKCFSWFQSSGLIIFTQVINLFSESSFQITLVCNHNL